jgi:hypothetical protein
MDTGFIYVVRTVFNEPLNPSLPSLLSINLDDMSIMRKIGDVFPRAQS